MFKENKKQKSEDFKNEVIELHQKGFMPADIARKLNKKYNGNLEGLFFDRFRGRVKMCIHRYKKQNNEPAKEKRVAIRNVEPSKHKRKWNGFNDIKIAIIGDTHFGSKYTQFTHLNDFYDICKEEGVKDIYHAGDLTDGIKMRTGHDYELYVISADDMIDDVVTNYPCRKGITTHFITGNHDASIYKHVGYDIGRTIASRRDDMDYLGRDCAVINLTKKCTLELRHPWDGSAYSLSYKPQKMIEAMEADSKPSILAIGHYHKAEYLFYRNIHSFQTGCFQGQTPFTRGKGLSVNLGGWIITIKVNRDGTIKRIIPQFIPYYKSTKDDYRNRHKDNQYLCQQRKK